MKYQYLLFDADNTLFDFDMAEHAAFRETCSVFGMEWSEEIYRKYSEINDGFWKMLERGEITAPELRVKRFQTFLEWYGWQGELTSRAEEINAFFLRAIGCQRFLMPHAEEVCRALAEKYPLYIITNGMKMAQESRMSQSVLRQYIRNIYISEEIGAVKPDPAFFEYVLRDIGDPDRSKYLVIGDSLTSDMDGAIASGLDCVWFNPKKTDAKNRNCTYTIHELPALLEILEADSF